MKFASVHFIGIGGINMSAVAKLLLSKNIRVSGSDIAFNDQIRILQQKGAKIFIGHDEKNIVDDIDAVVYSSAVPETNPERVEAQRRGIFQQNNFQFLGEWFRDAKTILVTGTHGKSTTTAMLGKILIDAGLDPTIIVGSKVPDFPDGNIRIGTSDIVVIEGDEYARHFLEFIPWGVIINNIELDHTDIFKDMQDMVACFGALLDRIKENGVVVANIVDERVVTLLKEKKEVLKKKNIISISGAITAHFTLQVPGKFNIINANGAACMAHELGVSHTDIVQSLESFKGIWRRFELLGQYTGALWFSDYAHHPTAVQATIQAAKEAYPGQRILVCFQPHHRNRTKHLFFDFVSCFEGADIVIICSIYDPAGRDATTHEDISSRDLFEAAIRHDREQGGTQIMEYAENAWAGIERIYALSKPNDIVISMGAGDIDDHVRTYLTKIQK